MTPAEMVAVLDDAIAAAPRKRRAIALELRAPGGRVVVGVPPVTIVGKFLGHDEGGPVFGFTRRQCEEIRAVILGAAAEDAGRAP